MRHSIAFCNSVSADRIGMAASTFLASAAASVILLCFASESRESHCNGCMKVANGALAADFFDFGIDDFPLFSLENPFEKERFKIVVFRFGVEIRCWSCKIADICGAVVRHSIALCNSVSADRCGMVASRCQQLQLQA